MRKHRKHKGLREQPPENKQKDMIVNKWEKNKKKRREN